MERWVGGSEVSVAHTLHMAMREEHQGLSAVGLLSLVVLLGSGLILATSFVVAWPPVVGLLALLVGLLGLIGALVVAFRNSRRAGRSFGGAVGQSARNGLRFLREFL